ncbi:E3 SUMO-protein ligase ZBED1-like [Prorops nasuta]|uniref:E3 SUMO-protein ligase ZBED1-like n=1 Tax=Prorops nasuta TaxID=863751 RepID=UPI0034CD7F65
MLKHLKKKHPKVLEGFEGPVLKKSRMESCTEIEELIDKPSMSSLISTPSSSQLLSSGLISTLSSSSSEPSTSNQHTLLSPTPLTSKVAAATVLRKKRSMENKYLHNQPTISKSVASMKSFELGGKKSTEITNAILYMIARDNCPLNTVEKKGFQKLMKVSVPMYQVPSRKLITKLIEEKYSALSSIVSERLSNVDHISLTTDIWTDTINTKSYIGLTAHYVWNNTLKTATLSVLGLSERHTANNISEWILEILEMWKIKNTNVVAIVSDNASNMTRAIKNAFGDDRFVSCFAHSLNLVATQVLSDKDIKEIVDKVKTIVTFFKHSVVASDEIRKKSSLKLIQSVPTRWNSTFHMLERFTELSLIAGAILLQFPESPPMLTAIELQTVSELMKALRPLEQITKELCAEYHVSVSKVIPVVNCLRNKLKGLNMQTIVGKHLCALLISALQDRFGGIENNKILAIATILDPRFKLLHFSNERALEVTISFIKNELLIVNNCETSKEDCIIDVNAEEDISDVWSFHKILVAAENKLKHDQHHCLESMPRSLEYYINFDNCTLETNPITFWNTNFGKSYPDLKKLASKYLPISATSVPSERLFSKAGNIMNEARNRLSSEHLHQILFLNSLSEEEFFY